MRAIPNIPKRESSNMALEKKSLTTHRAIVADPIKLLFLLLS